MSKQLTSKLKLTTESDDELIDQFEYNWPILDAYADSILVADGVTPPDDQLYDGCFVAEKTSGKLWIARRSPITGLYEKSWVVYPWSIGLSRAVPGGMPAGEYGWDTLLPLNTLNGSLSDVVGTRLVVPITGVYSLWFYCDTAQTGTAGAFNCKLMFNRVADDNTESKLSYSGNNNQRIHYEGARYLTAGTEISWIGVRWSAGNPAVAHYFGASLLQPGY